MLQRPASGYSSGRFLLVYHPLDQALGRSIQAYQSLLNPEDHTFMPLPLDRLIDLWQQSAPRPADRAWLSAFTRRYLDLSESEEEFQAWSADSRGKRR